MQRRLLRYAAGQLEAAPDYRQPKRSVIWPRPARPARSWNLRRGCEPSGLTAKFGFRGVQIAPPPRMNGIPNSTNVLSRRGGGAGVRTCRLRINLAGHSPPKNSVNGALAEGCYALVEARGPRSFASFFGTSKSEGSS